MVAFQSKIVLPELDDRTVPFWEGALTVQVFLFSLPLFNTEGTILTLDADTARGMTETFFGVFFPSAVPSFTEDICFKTNKPKKKKKNHKTWPLWEAVSLSSICNEKLTPQVRDVLSCLLLHGPPKQQSATSPILQNFNDSLKWLPVTQNYKFEDSHW